MASRTRKTWKPQRDGQYVRQLGWKQGPSGSLTQVKFRLGTDLREAKRREMMLVELWESIEENAKTEPVTWPAEALPIAKQIAREGRASVLPRENEPGGLYVHRVSRLAARLPGIPILPADEDMFRQAAEAKEQSAAEFVSLYEQASDVYRLRLRQALGQGTERTAALVDGGPTLHEALRDHIEWLRIEYSDADDNITAWGKVKVKQAGLLLDRHDDMPISKLDHDGIESMVRFWRQCPKRKGTDRPIAKKSAEHQITAIKAFLRWLSRSSKYDWKKPDSFDDIRVRVGTRAENASRPQVTPDDLFTLDELVLLNKYATTFERCLLLLGINCGFGRAEIASITVGEVSLRTAHEPRHQEVLCFKSTDADSFIKRLRGKTGVYGEHILFPQTVQAIEWAMARRRKHPGFAPDARLLVSNQGQPYDKLTAGGNPNQRIPNAFAGLIRRIQKTDEGKSFIRRPFKILRKTAGDLIRRYSDGEVTAVFHCRGQAVRIDDLADAYTTRPFGKVFRAIRAVQEYLQPMFDAAGDSPLRSELR